MSRIYTFLYRRKYELLLFALIQHLFTGIVLRDLPFYTRFIWLINMIVLGVASIGLFMGKGRWKNSIRKTLFVVVLALPVGLTIFGDKSIYFSLLNIAYAIFFLFIFWEVLRFLVRPGYINSDIISASACGYLLLIEICTFLLQFYVYQDHQSFKGVDYSNTASTFIDLVYFSSITLTSIGFGDITPAAHYTKLITALFGIAGQFYTVVLVGILISKFSSKTDLK
ncbi:MAG TPA: ion channel [Puia sp.]